MLLSSLPFAAFFIVFFLLYWLVFKGLKGQNLLILIGSYFFYGWWDWHLLFLLIGYSALNFVLGYYIDKSQNQKTKDYLLYSGVIAGLGALLYFKYVNFFILSFISAFASFNVHLSIHALDIILPLGISFYTFRTLSYLLDVHKNKMPATTDWIAFFSFVAFFPCILSGPIDKGRTFVPQLTKKRIFNYPEAADALRQILCGLFKKMIIADRIAIYTNDVYANYQKMPGSSLLLAVFYFSIQLYADFSGYSDMAIGVARLLGFNVAKNFNYPFFAQNIAEYWRNWHISLTSWLTEYVFTPLSIVFRDYGKAGLIMAILINFLIIGIWHGANWTFVLFGFLHGCYYVPLILNGTMNKKRKIDPNKAFPSFVEFKNMLLTFALVSFTLILFRSDSISSAWGFVGHIFSKSIFSVPTRSDLIYLPTILLFIFVEWVQRNKEHVLQIQHIKSIGLRWSIYFVMVVLLLFYLNGDPNAFIYIKF